MTFFEHYNPEKHDTGEPPIDFDTAELYEERCENEVENEDTGRPDGVCGGRVVAIGGSGYYNGHYDCYTLVLECENCGIYDVECV